VSLLFRIEPGGGFKVQAQVIIRGKIGVGLQWHYLKGIVFLIKEIERG
jgi:hypothetical protein